MQYRYRAFGSSAKVVAGCVEAGSRTEAMSRLKAQGLLVDRLVPALSLKIDWQMSITEPKLDLRALSVFFTQLSMLIAGGVPALQALQVIEQNSARPLSTIAGRMVRVIEAGQPLSRALALQRNVFPRVAVHVAGVSEWSGDLDRGLQLLAGQFDAEDLLQRKFISALTYPTVVLVMALGLAGFMTAVIVPNYAGMFKDMDAELPWQTRALLVVSDFMRAYWYLIVGGLGGSIGGFVYGMRHSRRFRLAVHRLLLRVPVFGPLIRNRETARYARTLGTLLRSGVPALSATQAAAELVENALLRNRLADIPTAISNGASLGRAVKETAALPPIMAELLIVGETIGNAPATLLHVASLADGDVRQTVDRLTSILEPVLILILGGIVLSIIVPLLLPMFDLYSKIK